MNRGPKLRSQPPIKTTAAQETLDRLEKLEDWTEEPAREAASALEPQEQPQTAPQAPQATPERRGSSKAAKRPWDSVEATSSGAQQSMNFKLPMELYRQLKWLANTTYGQTMNKIVVVAVEEKVAEMLKERGVK